ncbi:hypothetical protein [Apilactobacillus sp. EABW-1NA]|uniref:hypothetical protein n=1 Tax=Apilactobacillus sp. EABW-1NA TaxID=2984137 RepID=UPI0025AED7C1|nr:hypothetical protein [Apilactobacillus sp. EABW-1NA]MDN2613315.1 hypothetical protein [Apilactobacillus sp. EABW-1NA]
MNEEERKKKAIESVREMKETAKIMESEEICVVIAGLMIEVLSRGVDEEDALAWTKDAGVKIWKKRYVDDE